MSEFFEKIAADSPDLADMFLKVADEDVVGQMSEEEQLDEFLDDLEASGVDLEDPEILEGLKQASADDVYEYNLEKAVDIMSADFLNNVDKIASGLDSGFETAAAAKAVGQFFDIDGAAVFGSSFGPGNNQFGTTLSPTVDKNVFGGYGKQIMTSSIQPNAVNATSKLSNLINGSNMNIIKSASDDELLDFFYTKIAEAADSGNQSVDEFIHDLGMEALEDEIKEANNGYLKNASLQSESIFEQKWLEREESKEASDIAFDYVDKVASELNAYPDDLVLEYGLEKAADYIGEVLEKIAEDSDEEVSKAGFLKRMGRGVKSGLTSVGRGAKNLFVTPTGRIMAGTALGAGLGGYVGGRKGLLRKTRQRNAIQDALIGGGAGLAGGYGLNKAMSIRKKKNEEKLSSDSFENTLLDLAYQKLYNE